MNSNPMNTQKWNAFFQETSKLQKPAKSEQLLSKENTEDLKFLLVKVLQGYFDKTDLHVGLKVYINKELRNDYIDIMAKNPPTNDCSLERWSEQIFNDQKFGIILMGIEEYSNALAEKAANIVQPLLQIAGLPLDGLSFLFFMGNYGFTPFGIHKEATGEEGFLFHLGPNNKQFYTWDHPRYNAIKHNSEVFHNVHELLKESTLYDLNPGDVMFIPHYVYHIADSPSFSVSMVLDYINPPKDRFENQLIKETSEENLKFHNSYETPLEVNTNESQFSKILDIRSIERKLNIALKRKILSLRSNGGIKNKSKRIKTAFPQTEHCTIQAKKVFPIQLDQENNNRSILYARGHKIFKENHDKLSELINELNQCRPIPISEIRLLMEPAWDLVETFSFIQELLSIEAVTITDDTTKN